MRHPHPSSSHAQGYTLCTLTCALAPLPPSSYVTLAASVPRAQGYTLVNDTQQHLVYCQLNPPPEVSFWVQYYWIWIIVAVVCVLLLSALIL